VPPSRARKGAADAGPGAVRPERCDRDDHAQVPEARNPISETSVVEGLVAALARAQSDTSVRALILTGSGSAFSSGGNIRLDTSLALAAAMQALMHATENHREAVMASLKSGRRSAELKIV